MALNFIPRFRRAWNAFNNRDPTEVPEMYQVQDSMVVSVRPDMPIVRTQTKRSLANTVFTKIAIDAASYKISHVRLDGQNRYSETIHDGLNRCLTLDANRDQTGRALIQDIVYTMLSEGVAAIMVTDADRDPELFETFDIRSLRCGVVREWGAETVKLEVFNEELNQNKEILLPKRCVALPQNPFYMVMNRENSNAQRLIEKMAMLDGSDKLYASGKLNLLVQVPYTIKGEAREKQSKQRSESIHKQLKDDPLGIAYIDSSEKVTQLNRPVENTLREEVNELYVKFLNDIGMTENVMNGTADESELLAYYSHTIEPILSAITDEMMRKFISRTAQSEYWNESLMFYRDPFKLATLESITKSADVLTRNAIFTSNEIRQKMAMAPAQDRSADMLVNSNMPIGDQMIN